MNGLRIANLFSAAIALILLSFVAFVIIAGSQRKKNSIGICGQDYMLSDDGYIPSFRRPLVRGHRSLESSRVPPVTFVEASVALFGLFETDASNGNTIVWVEDQFIPFYQHIIAVSKTGTISRNTISLIYKCSKQLVAIKELMKTIAEDNTSRWYASENPRCICCVADLVEALVEHVDAIADLENRHIVIGIKRDLKLKLPVDLTFSTLVTAGAKLKRELERLRRNLLEVLPLLRIFVRQAVIKHVDHRCEPAISHFH